MSASSVRWFLTGALLVSGLHMGEALSLLFSSGDAETSPAFAVVVEGPALERRS